MNSNTVIGIFFVFIIPIVCLILFYTGFVSAKHFIQEEKGKNLL